MTDLASAPKTEGPSLEWLLQQDEGVAVVFGEINAVRSSISKLGREYRGLTASAAEIRYNISGIRTDFEEASNDVGRIFDEVERLNRRTEHLEAALARNTELLEKLANHSG